MPARAGVGFTDIGTGTPGTHRWVERTDCVVPAACGVDLVTATGAGFTDTGTGTLGTDRCADPTFINAGAVRWRDMAPRSSQPNAVSGSACRVRCVQCYSSAWLSRPLSQRTRRLPPAYMLPPFSNQFSSEFIRAAWLPSFYARLAAHMRRASDAIGARCALPPRQRVTLPWRTPTLLHRRQ